MVSASDPSAEAPPPTVRPRTAARRWAAALAKAIMVAAVLAAPPAVSVAAPPPTPTQNPALVVDVERVQRQVTHAPVVFAQARVGGDVVELTTPLAAPQLIGYHEASFPDATPLTPRWPVDRHEHPDAVETLTHTPRHQPPTVVLPSRNRPTEPTTAVDVMAPAHDPSADVLAPVTGEVVNVEEYVLYDEHPDGRVDIAVDGADAEVAVIHVTDPLVGEGDRVHAGRTRIARHPTAFPFESQIDRAATHPRAHVHLEVKHP